MRYARQFRRNALRRKGVFSASARRLIWYVDPDGNYAVKQAAPIPQVTRRQILMTQRVGLRWDKPRWVDE